MNADVLQSLQRELTSRATLIAVSKFHPIAEIEAAYALGQRDFGESRVQELDEKAKALSHLHDLRWHFIGHLQTNKVKLLVKVPHLDAIHSADSLKLLDLLVKEECRAKIFLEVNTSGEEEKGGFRDVAELRAAIEKGLDVVGLMTMGTIRTENVEEEARRCFSTLQRLRDEINTRFYLSMGMSDDYRIAIEYGATHVRIGSAIFGERK